eukprot:SAG31_NODE_5604_length_2426_cov_3.721960_2_plen_547_part_01
MIIRRFCSYQAGALRLRKFTQHYFLSWHAICAAKADARFRLNRYHLLSFAQRHFSGWKGWIARKRYIYYTTAKFLLEEWCGRRLRQALHIWCDRVQERRQERQSSEMIYLWMLRRRAHEMFLQWKALTPTQRSRVGLVRLVHFLVFQRWKVVALAPRQRLLQVMRYLARKQRQLKRMCLLRWSAASKIQKKRNRRMKALMLRAICRNVALQLHEWHAFTARSRRIRLKALAVLQNRQASRAFGVWQTVVSDASRQKRLLQRAARKMLNKISASCFQTWRSCMVQTATARQLLSRAAARLSKQKLASAFLTWSVQATQKRRNAVTLRKAVVKMIHQLISRIFETWADEIRRVSKLRASAKKVVQRLLQKALVMAFEGWIGWSRRQRVTRDKIASRLGAVNIETQRTIMIKWHDVVVSGKRNAGVVKKLLGKVLGQKLAVCFYEWHGWAASVRQLRAQVTQRLRNRALSSTFIAWADKIIEGRRMQVIVGRVMARLLHRTLTAGFVAWVIAVETARQLRASAKKVVQRLLQKALVMAFEGWIGWSRRQR